jgi:D-alanine---D-serine ligase
MKKLTVAVFFGGCSPEYSVSLESASAVLRNLDPEKYQIVPVGITKDGDWFYFTGEWDQITLDTWYKEEDCIPAALSLNRSDHCLLLQ